MKELRKEIVACTYCVPHLALGPNPVLSATKESKIIIIGQAPGMVVHKSGIPWEDKSGDTLRAWMGIDRERFYDPLQVALIPMGFCYPGKGKSGDLPQYFVLPHPSPRNNIWQAKNTWFKTHVLPHLKTSIAKALA
ncbi:uracil-DNA glycosylase family protein [Flavobacteriaceae bacterium]|nr:uracil-DNA glycosylase family protein [Flavobacteriaceae bacterium]MDA9184021.1 uracil-DNA glycosylase family protein [Flavobacteriaceae bacterium]MDA9244686.1 uracil-DNA glycosylase family protein [Flavobacteriaceae bacterium]MDA9886509.1 uracil-DNA glycosylase family protein [Flavobacteriaceae bacterium]MDB2673081.1 uracil-DNA glycosylase family protein [Flavobacteriaceae bacterium]